MFNKSAQVLATNNNVINGQCKVDKRLFYLST